MDKKLIQLYSKMELAKRRFFFYCNLIAPDFYKKNRKYLAEFCNDLQEFYETDKNDILIINMPLRHGKSRTASMFTQWVFGKNQNEKVITGSYNETLSTTFSKNVKNAIQEVKGDKDKIVFTDIFPGVSIKQGYGAMNL